MTTQQILKKIIKEIEEVKDIVEEQTGSYKYSGDYDDCIKIIRRYLDEPSNTR